MEIPFWEESYKNDDISTFGIEPNSTVAEFESMYKKTWNILQFKSYTFEDEHPGAPKHFHAANKIVAQRIK